MNVPYEILGLGCAAVDDLLYVDSFPQADEKTPVRRRERQCGGLTATALVAATRLGARCAFAGVLGEDSLSRFVVDRLISEGIDMSQAVILPDARPVHSTIVVGAAKQSRNIFFEIGGLIGADETRPEASIIRSARVLFVDHTGMNGAIRAARIARDAGVPVVADLERSDSEGFATLLGLVDHVIVSQGFACRITAAENAPDAVQRLWNVDRNTVVVTAGGAGCWYRDAGTNEATHCPAFSVDVVDSTGCGDVFHGAYAAALSFGEPIEERVLFASAAAALKATKPGGQLGIPNKASVDELVRKGKLCHRQ